MLPAKLEDAVLLIDDSKSIQIISARFLAVAAMNIPGWKQEQWLIDLA